jgi:hypothetical protein
MKLLYLILTFIITFSLMMATTLILDFEWIQGHIIRQLIIYIIVTFELALGVAIMREIINGDA